MKLSKKLRELAESQPVGGEITLWNKLHRLADEAKELEDNYLDIDFKKTTATTEDKPNTDVLLSRESFEAEIREIVRDELAKILTYGVPEDFEKYMDRKVKESKD